MEVIGADQPIIAEESEKRGEIVESTIMNDETQLLRQDFLLHPDLNVGEYLQLHDSSVLDFIRYECGETSKWVSKISFVLQLDYGGGQHLQLDYEIEYKS